MSKIKYIGFYDTAENMLENRQCALAAMTKIDYICNSLLKNNYEIEFISPSWTNNKHGYYKGNIKTVKENFTVKLFATFGAQNRFKRILKYLFSLVQLFVYLLLNTDKNESVIVYHSIILSTPIRLAKKIKKFNLILQVEEVYQDAQKLSSFMEKSEYNLFNAANKYIFASDLLNSKLNYDNKPSIVLYGTYEYKVVKKCDNRSDKINIVYAGTFDPIKGGALAAIEATEYLPKKYNMNIIGFGSDEDTKLVLKKIEEIKQKSEASIMYGGMLRGEEYIIFLQQCNIGLSTQIPGGVYNESSFPSKVLSYLANGLRVVSARIDALEKSDVGSSVYYYSEQNAKSIAQAIMKINVNDEYDSSEILKKLDEKFTVSIDELLRC